MAMDMNKMMAQAQKMQRALADAQDEVKDMTFTATAGGGMVEVVAKGDGTLASIVIKPEVVDPDDIDMLQDLVLAAANGALEGVRQQGEERLSQVTGGISIPGLF